MNITIAEQLNSLDNGNRFIGSLPKLINSSINFSGNNNILYCADDVLIKNSKINFSGSNSVIFINKSPNTLQLVMDIYSNSAFSIGRNFYFSAPLHAVVAENKHFFIGDNCLFALGAWARTSDTHLIYSTETKNRINQAKSIYLGDHIWIGQSVMMLKGTQIHSGSIIGAMSVVSGKHIPSNQIWAGNPSTKRADNIFYDDSCVHNYPKKKLNNVSTCDCNDYIYCEDGMSFDKLDKSLTNAKSADEKFKILTEINSITDKHRFAFIEKRKKRRFNLFNP